MGRAGCGVCGWWVVVVVGWGGWGGGGWGGGQLSKVMNGYSYAGGAFPLRMEGQSQGWV